MSFVKIIANYLPQFHEIPENSKWWGEGFTDWLAVKRTKSLYYGHNQPRIPLNSHYYSLDDVDEIRWQAELARKYGVYGFGIYHYWFSSDMKLLEKPAELIRDNHDIDINYLFLWDNTSWTRTWSKERLMNDWAPDYDSTASEEELQNGGVLAKLVYGTEEDWKKHFDYLLTFFRDDRYIKINNQPLFGIFQPHNQFEIIQKMVDYWDKLAKENGFAGIICMTKDNWRNECLEYRIRYSPFSPNYFTDALKNKINNVISKKMKRTRFASYDRHWRRILKDAEKADSKTFLSGFVDFDDTPRRGNLARIMKGGSPDKFGRYMKKLIQISQKQNKEYVFVTAWNEWGEGAYLEPDEINGYAYLKALKSAIDECQSKK